MPESKQEPESKHEPVSKQENLGSGLTRSFRGYDPKAVDRIVRDLTARCEALERERDDLRQQLEASKAETVETRDLTARCEALERERDDLRQQLEASKAETQETRDLERTLRDTLVLAQRSADELKEQSRLEAEATLDDARGEARDIVGEADRRADLLRAELKLLEERERETRQRFSDMLRDTLAQVEGSRGEALGTGSLVDDLRRSADRVK